MDILGSFVDWVIKTIIEVTGGVADNLKFASSMNGGAINNVVNNVWDYFRILGIGLSLVYCIMEINQKWAFEGNSMTIKSFFVPFLKLAACVLILDLADDLCGKVLGFNDTFVNWCDTEISKIDLTDLSIKSKGLSDPDTTIGNALMSSLNFMEKLAFLIPLVLSLLICIVCNCVWVYKGLLYRVEVLARVMFAPIACADIYSGMSSTTVRYLKGTLALVIYGGTLVLLPKLVMLVAINDMTVNFVEGDFLGTLLSYIQVLVAPIAAIGLVGVAKNIIKEAVGA